jgi:hypothetical protein
LLDKRRDFRDVRSFDFNFSASDAALIARVVGEKAPKPLKWTAAKPCWGSALGGG